jgi:hypothetical protein
MRFRRLTSALLVMFAGSLFMTTSVASAGPKEDVAAATIQWAQTLGLPSRAGAFLMHCWDASSAEELSRTSKQPI